MKFLRFLILPIVFTSCYSTRTIYDSTNSTEIIVSDQEVIVYVKWKYSIGQVKGKVTKKEDGFITVTKYRRSRATKEIRLAQGDIMKINIRTTTSAVTVNEAIHQEKRVRIKTAEGEKYFYKKLIIRDSILYGVKKVKGVGLMEQDLTHLNIIEVRFRLLWYLTSYIAESREILRKGVIP